MNRYVGIFTAESIAETSFSADVIANADPVREEEYLLDLTGPYHNLLEKSEWDGESAVMKLQFVFLQVRPVP